MQTLAWCRPGDAQQLQPRALEVNEALRNQVEIVKIRAATGVALAGLGEFEEADTEVGRGLTLTQQCGYPGGLVWCWVARTFGQLRQADAAAAHESAARVTAIVGDLGGNRFWSEIVNWWTGAASDQPARCGNRLARRRGRRQGAVAGGPVRRRARRNLTTAWARRRMTSSSSGWEPSPRRI